MIYYEKYYFNYQSFILFVFCCKSVSYTHLTLPTT